METLRGIREGMPPRNTGLWALVLAAGAGSRFGGHKLRAPWGEGRLIDAALAAAKSAPVEGVILLHRPGDALTDDSEVRRVEVADWAEGMAASLRAGIAALPPDCRGAYVFLGDMPRIPTAVLQPLAQAVLDGAPAAAPTWRGRVGHPVLFSSVMFPALIALTGDRGGRGVIEALSDRLARIEAPDDGVLFDVDLPDQLIP
jgi:molybdenum cofactor cytidylyltransferase